MLVRSSDAAEAEGEVDRFITSWHVRPQTVTVLADFASIGKKPVRVPVPPELPQPNENVGVAIEPPPGPAANDFHAEGFFPLEWPQAPHDEGRHDPGYDDSLIPDPTPTCYELEVEPCMPTDYHQTAMLGVGRIPFETIEDASILFARGLVRERLLGWQAARVLMIANPGEPGMTLPLCETISRVTAAEFRNARVAIEKFYGPTYTGGEVLRAAGDANLIVYQGHLYHQHLFRQPYEEVPQDYYGDWAYFYWADPPAIEYIAGYFRVPAMSVLWHFAVDRMQLGLRLVEGFYLASAWYWDVAAPPEPPALLADAADDAHDMTLVVPTDGFVYAEPAKLEEPLAGFPVVVLQSCDSLDQGIMRRVHELGGSALLSTVTYMYSASGSAFVKAVCDGILYRRATLGEAVRDARNYFFCLQDLKNLRGHHQQAKSQRTALSFQLWGDPQLRVVPPLPGAPKIRPVAARWSAADELTIDVPPRRLERAASEAYRLRAFPGSGTAGLVRCAKDGSGRRVTPIYFFRLPLPAAFEARGFAAVRRPGDPPNRAVFRKRVLWISGALVAPVPALWLLGSGYTYLLALQVFSGATWAGFELAMLLLFFETIPKRKRLAVLTVFNVGNAAAIAVGSLLGGAVLAGLGSGRSAYLAIFALSAVARGAALVLVVRLPQVALKSWFLVTRAVAMRPSMGTLERPVLASLSAVSRRPPSGPRSASRPQTAEDCCGPQRTALPLAVAACTSSALEPADGGAAHPAAGPVQSLPV